MMNLRDQALDLHRIHPGKLTVSSTIPIESQQDLSLAYSPGVAEPCLEIYENYDNLYQYTSKGRMLAVVTNGTAVLGLGHIGAAASLPVMEGKAILFKVLANIDAFPICIHSSDPEDVIRTVKLLESQFGAVNLEDIAAPDCFLIEERLKQETNIPIFHDDQHGTAIVTLAGLLNALKLLNKPVDKVRVVINGCGAAGIASVKLLTLAGFRNIIICDTKGIIHSGRVVGMNAAKEEIASMTNPQDIRGNLEDALEDADVFVGLSVAGAVTPDMVRKMKPESILFAMANPIPEIFPEQAIAAGAKIVGTGRSDYPNQINNVLAFPGIFRGALDCRASQITDGMKLAAARAIASLVSDEELRAEYVIPTPLDPRVVPLVAEAVSRVAVEEGIAKMPNTTPRLA